MKIDERVQSLVAALNTLEGLDTFSSCGGHEPPLELSQVPADEFNVNFAVEETPAGWRALAKVAEAIAKPEFVYMVDLVVWFDGCVNFELEGRGGLDPDLVAQALR